MATRGSSGASKSSLYYAVTTRLGTRGSSSRTRLPRTRGSSENWTGEEHKRAEGRVGAARESVQVDERHRRTRTEVD